MGNTSFWYFLVIFWYFISQRTRCAKGEDFKFCLGFRPLLEWEHFWGAVHKYFCTVFNITYLHFACHQSSRISQNLSPGKFLLSSDIYEYRHEVEQGASPSHHPTNKEQKNLNSFYIGQIKTWFQYRSMLQSNKSLVL